MATRDAGAQTYKSYEFQTSEYIRETGGSSQTKYILTNYISVLWKVKYFPSNYISVL